eukprot:1148569-Pelagomonas_calceolata.AAC.5
MPFDSDFLLGLKQQAGCSSPAEGPASQSALLPALLWCSVGTAAPECEHAVLCKLELQHGLKF